MLVSAVAKVCEAQTVVVADIDRGRLDFAVRNGFADAYYHIHPRQHTNEKEAVQVAYETAAAILKSNSTTANAGFDVTFECTGAPSSTQAGIYATRAGGRVVLVGMGSPVYTIPVSAAALREVDLVGSFRYAHTYPQCIEIVMRQEGRLPDLSKLITHTFDGLDSVQEAFRMAAKSRDDDGRLVLKVMVRSTGEGGRMGARHALHFLHMTPRANLAAVFSPDDKELAWAARELEPYGVTLYRDYDEMIKHAGLEAVCVATATTVHAEQSLKAIAADLHVLCEKPISTSVEISTSVIEAAKRRPHLKFLCGFSRRFDASYRDAHDRVAREDVGRACVVRSQTGDRTRPDGYFVGYSKASGGIFVDANIHDIDLALWFLGEGCTVKSCYAIGITALHPEMKQWGDVDNGMGVIEFWNGKMAYVYSTRTFPHGQHDQTEIIGTSGKITVNAQPQANLVEIAQNDGLHREIPQTYYDRFREAFVTEANEFTAACLTGASLPFGIDTAIEALRIGEALQQSLQSGQVVRFDQGGKRLEGTKANL
ncbi:MAG: hypothetical protein Q9162_002148 [Coniocarpon cinnabarinum]